MSIPFEIPDVVDRIFDLLNDRELSAAALCYSINMPETFLNDVKDGLSTINDNQISTIAQILGQDPDYLKYGFVISPSLGMSTECFLRVMLDRPDNPTERDKEIMRFAAEAAQQSDQTTQ